MKIASIPYKKTFNINLEFTVQSYESLIGPTYASQCTCGSLFTGGDGSGKYRNWDYFNGRCTCTDLENPTPNPDIDIRHTSSQVILWNLFDYMNTHETEFDSLGLLVAHRLTAGNSNIGGMAYYGGKVFTFVANEHLYDRNIIDFGTYGGKHFIYNMKRLIAKFQHEFNHCCRLLDHYEGTLNEPCTQGGAGFDEIIYAESIYCSACMPIFNVDHLINGTSISNEIIEVPEYGLMEYEDEAALVFISVSDYIEQLSSGAIAAQLVGDGADAAQAPTSQPSGYYLPTEVPEDAELESIVVTATSTTFNYAVPVNYDILVDMDNEYALYDYVYRYFVRRYNLTPTYPNVDDPALYAQNIAEAIGASPVKSSDLSLIGYEGDVVLHLYRQFGAYELDVATQSLFFDTDGTLCYKYRPAGYRDDPAFSGFTYYAFDGNEIE